MKGIIFNLVEDAVLEAHGQRAWDQVLERADLDGAYTALGNYPDTDLVALVEAASSLLGLEPRDLTRQLGRAALTGLATRYPRFFEPYDSVRPFLLTINDVIHPEVRKLHADAQPPDFWFDVVDEDTLVIHYQSQRRLCALAEGMVEGAAAHYGQRATVVHGQCMLEGATHCTMTASFSRVGAGAGTR